MEIKKVPEIKKLEILKQEQFGQIFRQVFFSPRTTCSNFLKMAFLDVPPGSVGTPHIHLGDEIVYTIKGKAILTISDNEYVLEPGTCFLIPTDAPHPAKVVGTENWVAIAAYCDECPVLKKERDQVDVDYPIILQE
ncbi:MAG: cupin domain-containing protein [Veillonellaceae bacterium]|mgnify:CR=1 FL=1|nr:cupin domain-containing protein [Veillonellaceae bacterium]